MPVRMSVREVIDVRRIPASTEDNQGAYVAQVPTLDVLWPDGSDANEIDDFKADFAVSIGASSTASLDLSALTNGPDGGTVNLAEVRAILLRARSTNGDAIRLKPNASNGWTALGASLQIEIPPGGYFRLYCGVDGGLPVSGTDKVLDMENLNGAAAGVVDVLIAGVSA